MSTATTAPAISTSRLACTGAAILEQLHLTNEVRVEAGNSPRDGRATLRFVVNEHVVTDAGEREALIRALAAEFGPEASVDFFDYPDGMRMGQAYQFGPEVCYSAHVCVREGSTGGAA